MPVYGYPLVAPAFDALGSPFTRGRARAGCGRADERTPERDLVAAVVLAALEDPGSPNAELRADAERFFADRSDTPWSSWGWAAGVLDMDVDLPGLAREHRPRSGGLRRAMTGLGVPESAPEIGGVPGSIRADREGEA